MEKYRRMGLKLTPQRLAVLHYLEGNKNHPSAEDIFRAVHKKLPTMSFATVYNTLSILKEKGSVLELTVDPDKKRYDPDTGQHDHLICISCKRIVDIPSTIRFDLPDSARRDFAVIQRHVEYYGYCPECNKNRD
jgi:Fur family peroxide stress response transcriptional regulator